MLRDRGGGSFSPHSQALSCTVTAQPGRGRNIKNRNKKKNNKNARTFINKKNSLNTVSKQKQKKPGKALIASMAYAKALLNRCLQAPAYFEGLG